MKNKSPIPKKRKDVAATRPQNVEWIDMVNPHFFRNPVYIRHMHVLCILDYIHTRS